jgi:acid stress chaperone HdeB
MKRTMAAAALAATLLALPVLDLPANAETVDLATVKCSELASMKQDDADFMFAWLLGYAGGQTGTTTIDLETMGSVGTEIGEYCAQNPDVGLLSAATAVMTE